MQNGQKTNANSKSVKKHYECDERNNDKQESGKDEATTC